MDAIDISLALRTAFGKERSFTRFYTGGPLAVSSAVARQDALRGQVPEEASAGLAAVCACDDGFAVVSLATGTTQAQHTLGAGEVLALAAGPRLERAVVFSRERLDVLQVVEVATGAVTRTIKTMSGPVVSLVLDPTGNLAVTGSTDGKVRVWNVDKGFCTHNFKGHRGMVTAVAFHPQPDTWVVFSGADDGTIRVWDMMNVSCLGVMEGHMSSVTSIAFSSDGSVMVSASRDGVIIAWSVRDRSMLATIPVYEIVEAVVIVEASELACESAAGEAVDRTSGKSKSKGKSKGKKGKKGAKLGDGLLALTAGEKGCIRAWSLSTQQVVRTLATPGNLALTSLLVVPGDAVGAGEAGSLALLSTTVESDVLTYALPDGQLTATLSGYHDEILDSVLVGEDEAGMPRQAVVASNSNVIKVVDLATGSSSVLEGHDDVVFGLALAPSGTALASASKDRTVKVWDMTGGKLVASGAGHTDAVSAVTFFSRDSGKVVTGSKDNTLKVWQVNDTGDVMEALATARAHPKDINALAVAPNDSLVASASQDKTVKVWSLPDLDPVATLSGHRKGVWDVQFSRVDRVLASASSDKTVKIWSARDYSCLRTLEGHAASVLRVRFVSAGMQVATTAADGIVKVFTLKTSSCAATIDAHNEKIWALDVAADGEYMLTGGADSALTVWRDQTAVVAAAAAAAAEDVVLKEQRLANALASSKYSEALELALELKQPRNALRVLQKLDTAAANQTERTAALAELVAPLSPGKLETLLGFAKMWNTIARNAFLVQSLLHAVFTSFDPEDLVSSMEGSLGSVLTALEPYTIKHAARLDRLYQASFLLDITLNEMDVLQPLDEAPGAATSKRALDNDSDDDDAASSPSDESAEDDSAAATSDDDESSSRAQATKTKRGRSLRHRSSQAVRRT
ncbi:WD repeat protein SAZD [Thecamonas trahens ATCC 50062]|uniref:WD repeat protein SAZD n=1 Tax=Thecamonas trahens ATCC 50062 TaxID=461836 RepID=A0A0L0DFE7_THETB|nr:WD repeat protein SAZD [Thecamonas trahens ATCC 50062]KNC50038.1 WD repeat protein SAZD [Thecamonas trahens ATCC 50062]|eukprot:XP_013757204.1 WD repeat protein SAZD [Thecamonas trahens ATCC 50062]